ncbi:hypothetical protein M440DRAFT_186949 [Trichoderma longibrachiatum ATCC 18648]|uniref:Transmembrane protein n=1 Tax=Trichoderma longibrachiatum ATCC 18648 TaxID=983965 RepID=A0A2T4CF79_TRILO|nr:hypothetical protein M440DRAFT_186949 [Trichoderma longibrachiatum ATCC 18648]
MSYRACQGTYVGVASFLTLFMFLPAVPVGLAIFSSPPLMRLPRISCFSRLPRLWLRAKPMAVSSVLLPSTPFPHLCISFFFFLFLFFCFSISDYLIVVIDHRLGKAAVKLERNRGRDTCFGPRVQS